MNEEISCIFPEFNDITRDEIIRNRINVIKCFSVLKSSELNLIQTLSIVLFGKNVNKT